MGKMTKMTGFFRSILNGFYNRLNVMTETAEGIQRICGSTVAHYLVTDLQVKRFEVDFVKHFDKALQNKMQTEFRKFVFDLEHTRDEAVRDFNSEIHNGWWFSNKVGWFLYMSNLITILGAFLYCYFK